MAKDEKARMRKVMRLPAVRRFIDSLLTEIAKTTRIADKVLFVTYHDAQCRRETGRGARTTDAKLQAARTHRTYFCRSDTPCRIARYELEPVAPVKRKSDQPKGGER